MAALTADWNVSRIAEFRTTLGLSQVAMAERVGISRPTLAKIESGETTKLSTINFLVTRLQEEFGDQFDAIELVEAGPNGYELHFERKQVAPKVEHLHSVPNWSHELSALSRKIMEVCSAKNELYLPKFHSEFMEILEAYENLSGMEISGKKE